MREATVHQVGSRSLWAFAVLLAGCAAARPVGGGVHRFTVTFQKGCPTAVTIDPQKRSCSALLGLSTADDCLRVSRDLAREEKGTKGEATVEFVGAEGGRPFRVYFQPFAPLQLPGGKAPLDLDAPYKRYPFSIVVDGCPVLDPDIIIEK